MTKPPTRAKLEKNQRTFCWTLAKPASIVLSHIYKNKRNINMRACGYYTNEYYTSPITPTNTYLLFVNPFLFHKPFTKFSSLYVKHVCCFSSVQVC